MDRHGGPPPGSTRLHLPRINHWSNCTVIGLVIAIPGQLDHADPETIPLGRFRLTSAPSHGIPNPTWIPATNKTMRRLAADIDGIPMSSIGETFDTR